VARRRVLFIRRPLHLLKAATYRALDQPVAGGTTQHNHSADRRIVAKSSTAAPRLFSAIFLHAAQTTYAIDLAAHSATCGARHTAITMAALRGFTTIVNRRSAARRCRSVGSTGQSTMCSGGPVACCHHPQTRQRASCFRPKRRVHQPVVCTDRACTCVLRQRFAADRASVQEFTGGWLMGLAPDQRFYTVGGERGRLGRANGRQGPPWLHITTASGGSVQPVSWRLPRRCRQRGRTYFQRQRRAVFEVSFAEALLIVIANLAHRRAQHRYRDQPRSRWRAQRQQVGRRCCVWVSHTRNLPDSNDSALVAACPYMGRRMTSTQTQTSAAVTLLAGVATHDVPCGRAARAAVSGAHRLRRSSDLSPGGVGISRGICSLPRGSAATWAPPPPD
jgi:hypothetical protein